MGRWRHLIIAAKYATQAQDDMTHHSKSRRHRNPHRGWSFHLPNMLFRNENPGGMYGLSQDNVIQKRPRYRRASTRTYLALSG